MNNDLIHLLPDSVANQIAAGEVIQRPASVVKELIENSVDAGATKIHLFLTDSGRTNIQVIDDGKGMSETDARMSFERHATSKISDPSDLFALHTFGFRGEALASIAAVAQVELRTRRHEDELGTVLHIAGSRVEKQEPDMCAPGTNFQVKNLFFNVPARRKFLKSNQTELSNILTEVERIALVNPEIEFVVKNNEVELMHLQRSGIRQRIQQMFGKKVGQELLPIEVETTIITIKGYVGVPESARKKGAHTFFFINGRYMRHPYFHKAVMEAYSQLIPPTEQIPYFLYLTTDPTRIDVNIHPTKTEIKFEDEQAIWQILMASVRETLGRSHATPSIDFDLADCPDIPVHLSSTAAPQLPKPTVDNTYNPFAEHKPSYNRPSENWEQLFKRNLQMPQALPPDEDSLGNIPQCETTIPPLFNHSEEPSQPSFGDCCQCNGRYIITTFKGQLMIIDQHRAHVRVLHDQYIHQLQNQRSASQGLLFPEMLQLSVTQSVVLEELLDDFTALGFDLSNLGGGSYSIQGIPAGIEGLNPTDLVRSMLDNAIERGSVLKEDVHGALALAMARSAAIVVGQVLSPEEMHTLVNDLLGSSAPAYTPDGKKVYHLIDEMALNNLLG